MLGLEKDETQDGQASQWQSRMAGEHSRMSGRTDAEDRMDVDRLDLVPRERQFGEVGGENVGPERRAVPECR